MTSDIPSYETSDVAKNDSVTETPYYNITPWKPSSSHNTRHEPSANLVSCTSETSQIVFIVQFHTISVTFLWFRKVPSYPIIQHWDLPCYNWSPQSRGRQYGSRLLSVGWSYWKSSIVMRAVKRNVSLRALTAGLSVNHLQSCLGPTQKAKENPKGEEKSIWLN